MRPTRHHVAPGRSHVAFCTWARCGQAPRLPLRPPERRRLGGRVERAKHPCRWPSQIRPPPAGGQWLRRSARHTESSSESDVARRRPPPRRSETSSCPLRRVAPVLVASGVVTSSATRRSIRAAAPALRPPTWNASYCAGHPSSTERRSCRPRPNSSPSGPRPDRGDHRRRLHRGHRVLPIRRSRRSRWHGDSPRHRGRRAHTDPAHLSRRTPRRRRRRSHRRDAALRARHPLGVRRTA